MVESQQSSSSAKRPLISPPSSSPSGKRPNATEDSSSSTYNLPPSEEVKPAVVAKESGSVSADLAKGGGAKKSSDEKKAPEAVVEVTCGKKSNGGVAWGKLISQCPHNPHVVMHRPTFTIGQGRQCDLFLGDLRASKSLCNLYHIECEGERSVVCLEITGEKGAVKVNGKTYALDSTIPLRGGDELVFGSSDKHCYIFQQLTSNGELATVGNENLNIDTEIGKIVGENNDLRPDLHFSTGPTGPAYDVTRRLSRICDKHRGVADVHKGSDPPISMSSRREQLKDALRQGLIHSKNIAVTFENFPYYLSETTKNVLIASTYMHLRCNKFTKFTSSLPTVSSRILLSGPGGSEIYQETLAKAIAKYYGARLLMVDIALLPGGPITNEVDCFRESSKPESFFSKQTATSRSQPKKKTSTATSKNYTFRKGDRVKYVGPLPPGFSPTQSPIR